MRRWRWTTGGVLLTCVALPIWFATFRPHGGGELSSLLFPIAHFVLRGAYRGDVPTLVWFAALLFHWPLIGIMIDLFRARLSGGDEHRDSSRL